LTMPINALGDKVEQAQNATLALLGARSREEFAKTLLGSLFSERQMGLRYSTRTVRISTPAVRQA
jgi:hypothetical protein